MISDNVRIALISSIGLLLSMTAHAIDAIGTTEQPISPIPLTVELDDRKVELGKVLFNDTRLSDQNNMSCASCHLLDDGGDDNIRFGLTPSGESHIINTPTVFNSRYNFRQNWDGSAIDLRQQVEMLIPSHLEANTSWEVLLSELADDTVIRRQFEAIYPDGVTRENYLDAMVEFEQSLITPNARFDQYLRGDLSAITNEEQEGYQLFKEYGCISCHQGINVGGNLFQKFGIFYNYFDERGNIKSSDYGRQNQTERYRDKHVFKVPTLRNIELTGPYFHDGSTEKLEDAIKIMGKTQLGVIIPNRDVKKIEAFLQTLTGEYLGRPLKVKAYE